MSTTIDLARECCERLTPRWYAGLLNKTRQLSPFFWRDTVFNRPDAQTDKKVMYWTEIMDENPEFIPPTVCPCDDMEYIADDQIYNQESATFPYSQLGWVIDCDFEQYIEADEIQANPDGNRSLDTAIEREIARKAAKVERSFLMKEELWSAMAAIKGKVTIEGEGVKKYDLVFERHSSLTHNLTGADCWGKDSCNVFSNFQEMDSRLFDRTGGATTHIMMNRRTCDLMRQDGQIRDCIKEFNPRLFLSQGVIDATGSVEPRPQFRGARFQFRLPESGIEVWCVSTKFKFKDPISGALIDVDLLQDGEVVGFDLGSSDISLGAHWAYGAIRNFHAENKAVRRFGRSYIPESGKAIKGGVESAGMPLILCPDASWKLNVCKVN